MIDFDNTDLVNKPKNPTGTQEYDIPDFDDNGIIRVALLFVGIFRLVE